MSPICVPSFSLIGIHVHILKPKMQNVQKKKEDKNEEIKTKFWVIAKSGLVAYGLRAW